MRPNRVATLVLAAGVACVAVAALAVLRGSAERLHLSEVPEGVSTHRVHGRPVFLLRRGDDVRAFVPDPRHIEGDTVLWCPEERIFLGAQHGEQFDETGRYIGGPAQGGLNTYPVRRDGLGFLRVDTDHVLPGPPRSERSPREGLTGAEPFCQEPVRPLT